MKKHGKFDISEVPNLVLQVWCSEYIDATTYDKAIKLHPEYFPEEVEYRRKWESIPDSVKQEYFSKTSSSFIMSDNSDVEDEVGKCPHPELQGKGIIWRVTEGEKYVKEMMEIDEWIAKVCKVRARNDVDLYNRLFAPYGLTKTHEKL